MKNLVILCLCILPGAVFAQSNQPAPQNWTSEQDHQNMMAQLHITSLRPGADGWNQKAQNAANYDEAKANPYPVLPDPLKLNNGQTVINAKQWWRLRRPEIEEDFDREVYGRVPGNVPKVTWQVVSVTHEKNGDYPVVVKKLVGHVDNSGFPSDTVNIELTLGTPENAAGPVPVMMQFGFTIPPGGFRRPDGTVIKLPPPPPGPTPQQQLLAKGWGYAFILPYSYQADNGAGLTKGIIGLTNKGRPRKPDDWGALRALDWRASRALGYF